MAKPVTERTYVLFKVDTDGPDLVATAGSVRRSQDLTLINQGDTALVVKGRPAQVKKFTSRLNGWRAEANTVVR